MLVSRFWIVLLSLALGASTFMHCVAAQMYNHAGSRAMGDALAADSSAVDWFLRDDARKRASALIPITLSPDIGAGLAKASSDAKSDNDNKLKVRAALIKLAGDVPPDLKFDDVWAVDVNGRVVAHVGVAEDRADWDMGGYSSVADAVHGWIRDDAWVWKGRIRRVVTRPVEREAQGEPVGAIIGAKVIDDNFARAVSRRTGAAVGFYADGNRVASGAPEGFDKSNLDQITSDLKAIDSDVDYQQKGRSGVRVLGQHLGVVYARLPGETWELGAGYAVGHLAVSVGTPFDFLTQADNTDKAAVKIVWIGLFVIGLLAIGIGVTVVEYNLPRNVFHGEILRLKKGEIDVLSPSRFRGAFKEIAADLNEGIEKVAAKGGAPRRAADLEQVLGPIPSQPQMSAFSVPGGPGASVESPTASGGRILPRPPVSERNVAPRLRSGQSGQVPASALLGDEGGEAADVRFSAPSPGPAPAPKAPPASPPAARRPRQHPPWPSPRHPRPPPPSLLRRRPSRLKTAATSTSSATGAGSTRSSSRSSASAARRPARSPSTSSRAPCSATRTRWWRATAARGSSSRSTSKRARPLSRHPRSSRASTRRGARWDDERGRGSRAWPRRFRCWRGAAWPGPRRGSTPRTAAWSRWAAGAPGSPAPTIRSPPSSTRRPWPSRRAACTSARRS